MKMKTETLIEPTLLIEFDFEDRYGSEYTHNPIQILSSIDEICNSNNRGKVIMNYVDGELQYTKVNENK